MSPLGVCENCGHSYGEHVECTDAPKYWCCEVVPYAQGETYCACDDFVSIAPVLGVASD